MDQVEGLEGRSYLAVAGMGEGPMKGPPLPAVGRLLPTLGLEGTGASGVIWVQCWLSWEKKWLPAPSVLFFHLLQRPKAPHKGPARAGRRQPWGIQHSPEKGLIELPAHLTFFFESCEWRFIWDRRRSVAQEAASQIALWLLQTGSGGKSIYKGLEKGEFNTMKHSFYKKLFVSHQGLMSPIRDLLLL